MKTEVQGMKIGDCVFITSATEMLVQVGLNLKKTSPHKHTFVAAYSNGYIQYGPPADYYDKGGYEVTECLLAPEWQQIYEKKSRRNNPPAMSNGLWAMSCAARIAPPVGVRMARRRRVGRAKRAPPNELTTMVGLASLDPPYLLLLYSVAWG